MAEVAADPLTQTVSESANGSQLIQVLEWSKRLERFRKSGVSLSQFCKDEKVGVHFFLLLEEQVVAEVSDRSIAPAPVAKPSDVTPASQVRFTIHAGSIKIVCEAESLWGSNSSLVGIT